jgi:repressor LexA
MNTTEMIKQRRKERHLTMKQVAEYVGVSEATVSRWESGNIANMGRDKIAKLAEVLDVSPSVIAGYEDFEANAEIPSQTQVPLFASVSAGFGSTREEAIGSFPVTNGGKDVIAVLVSGDSMSPTIADGDTIIVKRQTSVDYGDIAVVRVDEEHFVKKVEYTPEYIRLVSLNEKYPPIVLTGKDVLRCSVEGKVIGSYKRW